MNPPGNTTTDRITVAYNKNTGGICIRSEEWGASLKSKKTVFFLVFLLVGWGPGISAVYGDTVALGFQNPNLLQKWDTVPLPGIKPTRYLYYSDTRTVCALSEQSASGWGRRLPVSLQDYPWLHWEWRIESTVPGGFGRSKGKEDYPARVYLTFEASDLSWWERTTRSTYEWFYERDIPEQSLVIVWANRIPAGESYSSPYTERAKVYVVESGDTLAGKWVEEQVNLRTVYQELFDRPLPPGRQLIVMSDSDNTHNRARACYRNFYLRAHSR